MPNSTSRKPRPNPFYVLLMAVSTLFVVTSLGYLVGPYVAQRAIDRPGEAMSPGSRAMLEWFERKGVFALAIEFVAMLVTGILAMATDRFFAPPSKAPKPVETP